ncbi:hypothetical protein [Mycoplasmopsis columboralis]|uniref:Uncharacterized protein n=1 Tax=Mycoplasmopsis columboralis TaxID=171282 RepID=A0A449B5T9_9BACT|nr:hypothetical protein [Mycoplasmopsis columboralis]VEU75967.1 Uncharacterised protein [Mycoplasmopsis columboralis]
MTKLINFLKWVFSFTKLGALRVLKASDLTQAEFLELEELYNIQRFKHRKKLPINKK